VAPVGWWNNTKYLNKKELIPVPYTNMAAISLFWYTNMAAVTSDENDLYIYSLLIHSKTIIVLCNILNSQNIAGNIFVNEQCHRKLMFSGDIELNPCYQLKYLYISPFGLHIYRVYNIKLNKNFTNIFKC
jgi:hypothetical protein